MTIVYLEYREAVGRIDCVDTLFLQWFDTVRSVRCQSFGKSEN